ncbi:MAG TPA: bifunctional demethylmenaquinone methyltransferase/2-methoxy-6-polyprenyl-1,4-benzoquinol methylase UbiE [Candidatus Dormibacteraeota bacterium]|nr:bifunctional demethylmenaquinone methyltransferase/2-methoxy-6-polyprenyl-1,4-benzoquinol methylase UbiE [Candidatus Dormibacteraeota bacterium]
MSERDPQAVRSMFDRIARRYDRVNTVLSIGTDGGWRRRAARETQVRSGGSALDVACGSGKLTAELAKIAGPTGRVVGLDFSPRMLDIARRAHPSLEFVEGDALNLPFDDQSFDASTIAFGLRNLADPIKGLKEMVRVATRAVVLEFVRPPHGVVGATYRFYLRTMLPAIGGAISGDRSAYRYLSDTIDSYRTPGELGDMAMRAGWSNVKFTPLAMGTVGILSGKGADSPD